MRKYWLTVVVVFVSGTIAMWAALPIFFTDLYTTQVRLLVKIGRENTETPGTVQNGQVFSQGVREADISSEVEILSSRALVETVVDRLGVEVFRSTPLTEPQVLLDYPKYYLKRLARAARNAYKEFLISASIKRRLTEREEAVIALAKGVEVEPVRDSDILVLRVSTPAATLSVDVAGVMLEEYFLTRSRARGNSAGSDFFVARAAEAKQRLTELQRARAQIRVSSKVDSPLEERTQVLTQLGQIQGALLTNKVELERLRNETDAMAERSQALPHEVEQEHVEGVNPGIQPVQERITELKVERAKLATRYQSNSETVRKIETEIAELEAVLAQQPATIISSVKTETNPTRRGFEAAVDQQNTQIVGLGVRTQGLAESVPRLETRISDITTAMDALENNEREYRRVEQDYLMYSKRLEEARMSDALDQRRVANVVAVESPETPIEPSYPNRLFLIEIAMVVSLLLGLALAAMLEATEDRILNEQSLVSAGGVPCLGTIELERLT